MGFRTFFKLTFWKKLPVAAACLLAFAVPLIIGLAKAQTSARPAFEVASLRVVPDNGGPAALSTVPRRTPGRFTWTSTLSFMASYAFHLPRWRISGIEQDRKFYVISATMDPSATEDQVRLMLQAVLVERFKIAFHREAKDFSGYRLVTADKGPRLKSTSAAPVMPGCLNNKSLPIFEGRIITHIPAAGTSAMTGCGVTTAQLADELSENLGAFVVDQTGFTGKYYFSFQFLSLAHPSDDAQAPSIFSAIQNELGLRLEKQKGPVETLVIDHFEKPSED